jgi:predicted methyltransferase
LSPGWYTAILAPFVADRGTLTVIGPEPKPPADAGADAAAPEVLFAKKYADRLAASPGVFGKVRVRSVDAATAFSLGPDGSADAVVTFRNFYNWVKSGITPNVLAAAFKVLKRGGVLGVRDNQRRSRLGGEAEGGCRGRGVPCEIRDAVDGEGVELAETSSVDGDWNESTKAGANGGALTGDLSFRSGPAPRKPDQAQQRCSAYRTFAGW